MAQQIVYTFTINASMDTYIAGDLIQVVIEDTTNVVSVLKNGTPITSGDDMGIDDFEAGRFQIAYQPFSYCSNNNLVTIGAFRDSYSRPLAFTPDNIAWLVTFPYYQLDSDRDYIGCASLTSDIEKYGPPILQGATTETAQDGQVTLKVRSSNTVKFYYRRFAFAAGGFAADSVDNGVYTYTFLNLNAGPRKLYATDSVNGRLEWEIDLPYDKLNTYGLKYRGWFQSLRQGYPNGETWRVDLKFREYSDASSEIAFFAESPLMVDMGFGNVGLDKFDDLMCGTVITLNLKSQTNEQWVSDFSRVDEKNVLIEVYRGSTLMYSGFNIVEQYFEPWADSPYDVKIRFSDGLNRLKDFDYVIKRKVKDPLLPTETSIEPQVITGKSSALEIISFCLNKLGLGYGIRSCLNTYATGMSSGNSDDPLAQAYIDNSVFYDDTTNQPFDCETVINIILKSFPTYARLSSDGAYYYITPVELTGAEDYRQYDRYGTYEASGSLAPIINITAADGSGLSINSGGTLLMGKTYQLLQIVKEVRGKKSLVSEWNDLTKISGKSANKASFQGWNNYLQGDNISWAPVKIKDEYVLYYYGIDGNQCDAYIATQGTIEYQSADKFELEFTVYYDPFLTIFGGADPAWVPIRWLLKVGDYYYNQAGTWSTTLTINEYFLTSFRTETKIRYVDNFRPDISQTESDFEFRIYDADYRYYQNFTNVGVGNNDPSASFSTVASDMAAIDTTTLNEGNRYIYQFEYLIGGGRFINCYYVLRVTNQQDDGVNVIQATDNGQFKWVLDKTIKFTDNNEDNIYGGVNTPFYIKQPEFRNLPNGVDINRVDLIEKRLTDGNTKIKEIELPIFGPPKSINNAKRSVKNLWFDASGELFTTWGASALPPEEVQLEILSRHYKVPLRRINFNGFINTDVFGYNVIRHTTDNNRIYLIDSLSLNVKHQTVNGNIIEITSDTPIETTAFGDAFSSEFSSI